MSAPVLSWLFHALEKVRRRSQAIRAAARWSPQLAPQSPPSRRSVNPETPRPNPQSQSLSRGYGSIVPTSLIYIVLSTRGYTPWRPDAVMSTTRVENHVSPDFSRTVKRAPDPAKWQSYTNKDTLSPDKLIPGKNAVK